MVKTLVMTLAASLAAPSLVLANQAEATPSTAEEAPATPSPTPEPPAEPPPVPPVPPAPAAPPGKAPEAKSDAPIQLGGVSWTPSAEVRFRGEARLDPYAAIGYDQYFVGARSRLGLKASVGIAEAFVQVQDARNFGSSPPGAEGTFTGVHQGYLDLKREKSWLRVGRQEVNLGEQRLIGSFGWSTAARSFDGVRLHGVFGKLDLDLFGATTREQRGVVAGTPPVSAFSKGDYLTTAYLTYPVAEAITVEAYVLYRHDSPTEGALNRNRNIAAPGVRLHGKPVKGLGYKLEGTYQLGRANGADHRAFAVTGEASYSLASSMKPGFALGGAYATGADGNFSEFDNFFPTNHLFYGSADLFGLRNLTELYVKASLAPEGSPLSGSLALHRLGLATPTGRWSNAGGVTVGQSATNTEGNMGHELDLNLAWKAAEKVSVSGGYALFLPSQGAANLGRSEPTHWAYLMVGTVLP